MISKRQNVAWLRSRRSPSALPPHPSRQRTNLSMPTIGESSVISNVDYDHAYGEMDTDDDEFSEVPLKRPLRTRSCRIPTTSHSSSLKHKLKNRSRIEGWARLMDALSASIPLCHLYRNHRIFEKPMAPFRELLLNTKHVLLPLLSSFLLLDHSAPAAFNL